jgi:hypothetical protein
MQANYAVVEKQFHNVENFHLFQGTEESNKKNK